uniref:Uncharacterized protein MANES_03G082500 n=1 Tax=Rhizophora mucronata TaxID=61149 RepID=A0A2P2JX51_RHIMU
MSGVKMALEVEAWIDGDESAKDMLSRVVLTEKRPLLLLPLRGFPLRPGNVVELVGPSPSAKTHILMQVFHFINHNQNSYLFTSIIDFFCLFVWWECRAIIT